MNAKQLKKRTHSIWGLEFAEGVEAAPDTRPPRLEGRARGKPVSALALSPAAFALGRSFISLPLAFFLHKQKDGADCFFKVSSPCTLAELPEDLGARRAVPTLF